MTGKPSDKYEKVKAALAAGASRADLIRAFGVSPSTAGEWRRRFKTEQATPTAVEVKDMKIAALEQELKQRIPVQPAWQNETDYSELWRLAEEENSRRVEKILKQGRFTIRLPAEVQAITFTSDQHISTGNAIDLKRMREDAQLIAATDGVTALLGGDAIDNHIKIPAAILASRDQPEDQLNLLGYYLSIFAHRIGVIISGNHDNWTVQKAGVDVIRRLIQEKNCTTRRTKPASTFTSASSFTKSPCGTSTASTAASTKAMQFNSGGG